jgi:hypothetical protein
MIFVEFTRNEVPAVFASKTSPKLPDNEALT